MNNRGKRFGGGGCPTPLAGGRSIAVRAVLLVLLSLPLALPAQDLIVNASAGYGGFYRPGKWCPIVVSIHNKPENAKPGDTSENFSGQLWVTSKSMKERGGSYRYLTEVDVPVLSRKLYFLYVKFPEILGSVGPEMEIRTKNGKLLQRVPIDAQPLKKGQSLIVTITEQMSGRYYPSLPGSVSLFQRADLPPVQLPNHWAGYDPADVVVIPQWLESSRFQEHQERALEEWVMMGGTLVFLGGANSSSYAAAGESDLLPVRVSTSSQYRIDGDLLVPRPSDESQVGANALLLSDIDILPGAEVVSSVPTPSSEPVPIMVRKPLGNGQVLFCTSDLENPSREVRSLLSPHWLGVMPTSNILDWEWSVTDHLGKMQTVTGAAARDPNIFLIILICVLYTAIVGPVNFHVLSRKNRVQLAWLTVPAIVLLFSGLIYTVGTISKGGKFIIRELTVLEGVQNQPHFAHRSFISLFTPRAGDYFATPRKERMTLSESDPWHENETLDSGFFSFTGAAAATASPFGLGGRSEPVIALKDEKIEVTNWPLRTYDTARFEKRGPETLPGPLSADIRLVSQPNAFTFEGELVNNTGFDFYASALFLGGRGRDMGPMASGAASRLHPGELIYPYDSTSESISRYRWAKWDLVVDQIASVTQKDDDFGVGRRNSNTFLRGYFHPSDAALVFPPNHGRLLFVGLAESPEVSTDVAMPHDIGARSIVVIVELQPELPDGGFQIPGSWDITQIKLHNYSKNGFRLDEDSKRLEMLNSDCIISLESPFHSPRLSAYAIRNAVKSQIDQENQEFKAFLYNLKTNRLNELGLSQRVASVSPNDIMAPYSGRAYILIQSQLPPDKNSTPMTTKPTLVESLGFDTGFATGRL